MSYIKLESSDGIIFNTLVEIATCSGTIRTLLDDLGMTQESVVPLPNVNAFILHKVLQWADFHKDDPIVVEDPNKEKNSNDISTWDRRFLDVEQSTLFELMMAANYLDMKDLLEATCKTVANMIKGKTPAEIRETFNIKNDFTPAEEEQVRQESKWCEEKMED